MNVQREPMDAAVRRMTVLTSQLNHSEHASPSDALRRDQASASTSSAWSGIAQAPADPILGLSEAFKKDKSPDKINLGVGAYRTEVREAKPCVRSALLCLM